MVVAASILSQGNLPWVEKYRPKHLKDLISHDEIIRTINRLIDNGRLPHLLFYGPPGTGKTSTILAIAKRLYKDHPNRITMMLELNASDDRGIAVVREEIVNFASARQIGTTEKKLIILDEVDSMTKDAQNALRRIVEQYVEHVRFCLIGNFLQKIIPALQSRCTRFRFGPLNSKQMLPRLKYVADCEKVKVTEDGFKALLSLAKGDMRKSINVMQCTHLAHSVVNEETAYETFGRPLPSEVRNMLKTIVQEPIDVAFRELLKIKTIKSYSLGDIMNEMHELIERAQMPMEMKTDVFEHFAEIEQRLININDERIQLSSLIAVFQEGRKQMVLAAEDEEGAETEESSREKLELLKQTNDGVEDEDVYLDQV